MQKLRETLLAWMRGEGGGDFASLSIDVFRHQFRENTAYRNFCQAKGIDAGSVKTWNDIPAVPTDVFKLPDIAMRCFPAEEITGHFLTSGTSREVRGKHEYRSLDLYQASVTGAWRELRLPLLSKPIFLSQRPEHAPHSSLVRMFEFLDQEGRWLIDKNGAMEFACFPPTHPTALLGTSIALLNACDLIPPFPLPEGSWIFETGGSKGLRKSFSPEQVRQRLSEHFLIPDSRILNEYSMTELFSQCYKWGNQDTHIGPSWTAVRVVDVFTGKPAPLGETGYLEIIDLANLDTVSAIRTQDLAIAVGDREFILIGRDPGAIPRGCSRASDDLLNA